MNREEIITSTEYWEEWLDLTELDPIEDRADFIVNVVKEALSLTHTEGEEEFKVYTLSTYEGKSEWSHWSKGLTMIIKKDGITLELKGEELKELVKSLPRTFGGTY